MSRTPTVATTSEQSSSTKRALPLHVFVRGVDVVRLNARYKYPHPPHQIALQHVLEVVSDFGRRNGQMVAVCADEIQQQDIHRERVLRYQLHGTPGYKPNLLTQIDGPVTFRPSQLEPGLQLVDLVTYIYRRLDDHPDADARARAAVIRLGDTLRPVVRAQWLWIP